MADALAKVKKHLGRDAVILGTRAYTCRGRLGRVGEQVVEITATRDDAGAVARPRTRAAGVVATPSVAPSVVVSHGAASVGVNVGTEAIVALCQEIQSLKGVVARLSARQDSDPSRPPIMQQFYERLIGAQVAREIADDLVRRVQSELDDHERTQPEVVRKKLAQCIEAMLPITPPPAPRTTAQPTIMALVGPTGSGKTTTIAKLAANYQLRDRYKVGLITLDTYRVAAIEQLRTYAEVIAVPLHVVRTPEAMGEALSAMVKCDVILIDTNGVSPHDRDRLMELKRLLDAAKPAEVHLVLAGTSHEAALRTMLDRFAPLGVNRIICTKLDEAVGFGVVLTCLQDARARLSYVTTGPRVPEDIRAGSEVCLAEMIVPDDSGDVVNRFSSHL